MHPNICILNRMQLKYSTKIYLKVATVGTFSSCLCLPEEDSGTDVALSLRGFPLTEVISYLLGKHTCSTKISKRLVSPGQKYRGFYHLHINKACPAKCT